jgi:hypothetical protein
MAFDSDAIVERFEALGGDPREATEAARQFSSTQSWIAWQSSQVAASGAASTAIPGYHLLTISADIAFVLHKIAYCSWGVGALHGCDVEGKDDLGAILALWAGVVSEEHLAAVVAAAAAGQASAVSGTVATVGAGAAGHAAASIAIANPKLAAKGLGLFGPMVVKKAFGVSVPPGATWGGTLLAKKAAPAGKVMVKKAAPKLSAKLATKAGSKGVAGFVPFLGPAISAGVNAYIVGHSGHVADRYYGHKKQFQEAIAAQQARTAGSRAGVRLAY